jgi:hypothetical protein
MSYIFIQTTINFCQVDIEVEADYVPKSGGSREEPPEGGYCETLTVKLEGVDITDWIRPDYLRDIEAQVLQEAGL